MFVCFLAYEHAKVFTYILTFRRKWFRHPLSDKEAINNRLDVVEFFLQSSNFELASLLEGALKGTKNIVVSIHSETIV